MRSVKLKTLRDYFRVKANSSLKKEHIPAFYRFRDIFSPFTVLVIASICTAIPAFGNRYGYVIIASTILFLTYLYWYGRSVAQGIQVERSLSVDRIVEGTTITINYKLTNTSQFKVDKILFQDTFGPSTDNNIWEGGIQPLDPGKYQKVMVEKKCDGGMGLHSLGPIEITVSDPLGIFEFVVSDNAITEVMTYPSVSRINATHFPTSMFSNSFGFQEAPTSGHSINFTSLRQYVQGDPIKHIAWKASAKSPELLVKEFERSVNISMTVILNLDPALHIGYKSTSTWEICRDVCLGIIRKESQNNNTIQFVSNNVYVPFGQGMSHFSTISNQLCNVDIYDDVVEVKAGDNVIGLADRTKPYLLKKAHPLVPKFSTMIYITPYKDDDRDQLKNALGRYIQDKVEVVVIFVDPNTLRVPMVELMAIEQFPISAAPIHNFLNDLQSAGITCYTVLAKGLENKKQTEENIDAEDHKSYFIKRAGQ